MTSRFVSLELAISRHGPECPHCNETGFDDWHLTPGIAMVGGALVGRLRCHSCGRFFRVTRYSDGVTHSTIYRRRTSGGADDQP